MNKIKVLVADDHPTFREGLARFLDDEEDFECVAKVADGEEAVSEAKALLPDVAVMDIAMPKLNGIEAARKIRESCPGTAILIISAYDYESYVLAALKAGAAGFLVKNAPLPELISAVRLVHGGDGVFNLKAASRILRGLIAEDSEEPSGIGPLHGSELKVLTLCARGMSNREIGSELGISERTVQSHLVNIFKKLGVSSRTQAVLTAVGSGWLSLDDVS